MTGQMLFSLADVLQITGATKAQVMHWHGRGLLKPAQESGGTGHKRLFDDQELIAICGAVVLANDFHLPLRTLRIALDAIRAAVKRGEATVTITASTIRSPVEMTVDVSELIVWVRRRGGRGGER